MTTVSQRYISIVLFIVRNFVFFSNNLNFRFDFERNLKKKFQIGISESFKLILEFRKWDMQFVCLLVL